MATLNGITKIKDDAGDFLVLVDYGTEGISVAHQDDTMEGAVRWALNCGYGQPMSVVRLVHIEGVRI